jgi:hypothetical protein
MDDLDIRKINKLQKCTECRAAMMTFLVEVRQSDGTWKLAKVTRNCGHVLEDDPS